MAIPFFYTQDLNQKTLHLDADTSKHLIGVLKKNTGDKINLTDGKGQKALAIIIDNNRKKCEVQITQLESVGRTSQEAIGISLIKNTTRFEWFIEKATEIGIKDIIPMICQRTEKQHFRMERMHHIMVSALLQSQQCWLPDLSHPIDFSEVVTKKVYKNKYLAHCMEEQKRALPSNDTEPSIVLIGPEGDFSKEEIDLALEQGYQAISLGLTRLRSETAGVVAAVLLRLNNS
ncbi:MAG: 16S rRNA (uracil(1498)-N(3))-methyltransferase [Flavisolibacter sp.]